MRRKLIILCVAAFLTIHVAFGQQANGQEAPLNPMQSAESAFDAFQATSNPTYSVAVVMRKDPHEVLAQFESMICAGPSPRPCPSPLAYAAKAALEAGDRQRARSYAIEALQSAEAAASGWAKLGWTAPRSAPGVPAADYYANFVLGRLAIVDGDIRSAERYLLASGMTVGDSVARSLGPNMSLAFELLRRGDARSRQAVLQFLQEVKAFWNPSSGAIDNWSAQISAGETPVFRLGHGMPLLYH